MLSLLVALSAAAPATADMSRVDAKTMQWRMIPTGQQFARFYPDHAMRTGVSGAAVIDCLIMSSGALTDCTLVAEQPAAKGFGDAALHMTVFFKARPMTTNGQPTANRRVTFPIRFNIG